MFSGPKEFPVTPFHQQNASRLWLYCNQFYRFGVSIHVKFIVVIQPGGNRKQGNKVFSSIPSIFRRGEKCGDSPFTFLASRGLEISSATVNLIQMKRSPAQWAFRGVIHRSLLSKTISTCPARSRSCTRSIPAQSSVRSSMPRALQAPSRYALQRARQLSASGLLPL